MAGTSAARILANRLNARKSTGPKTPEGKARARANAVKHGLTGAGVALPTEDAASVELRFLTLQEEMGPTSLGSRLLVRQMALSSVRIERAAQQETAALATRIRNATVEFDLNRLREIDRLFDTIETCPGDHRRRLLTQPEGVDKLIAGLESARDQLQTKAYLSWQPEQHQKLEALFGGTYGVFPVTRTDALLTALRGDFEHLKPGEVADKPGSKLKKEFARSEMVREIERELAKLATIRANLDLEALERDRLEAADRALFDPDPAAMYARRYEAAATRGFFRALLDFRENEANAALPTNEVLASLNGELHRNATPQTSDPGEAAGELNEPKSSIQNGLPRSDPPTVPDRPAATDPVIPRQNEPNPSAVIERSTAPQTFHDENINPRRVFAPSPKVDESSKILNYRW